MNLQLPSILLFCISSFSLTQKHLTIIAHRGDHSRVPENTIEAFENAITNHADYVEVDLRTTRDGHLIVMHDASVDRTTNGHGLVRDLTYNEIRKMRIVNKNDPAKIYVVPDLEEVLHACRGRIKIYLDFKDADVSHTMQLISKYGMENDVVVYINATEQFAAWRKDAPQIPLMVSLPDSVKNEVSLRSFLIDVDADILDGGTENYTVAMVELANQLGKRVWVDVQSPNEGPTQWAAALSLRVNGVQTDHLEMLVSWLKKNEN